MNRGLRLQQLLKEMGGRGKMRKIFNFISKLCICVGLLIALIYIGGPSEFKLASALTAIFFGVFFGGLFWGLGYIVDKFLSKAERE
jgi:1,4-dihydroxy-2-naphthoate octaprenyltransferase